MLKIKRFFMNEEVIAIFSIIVMFIIAYGIIFLMRNADQKRCEKNGGVYIWEWSHGSKCHLEK